MRFIFISCESLGVLILQCILPKDDKVYSYRMNTYEMTAFHHRFDVFEFHEATAFSEWFESHVSETTINEGEEVRFQVAPEHMLLLSDGTAIFNRFKFNYNLHLPPPFCRWTIAFGHDDHNTSTNSSVSYGSDQMKAVKHIRLGFVVVADPVPEEYRKNLTKLFPELQWKTGDWLTTTDDTNSTMEYRDVWCGKGNVVVQDMFCAHLEERPEGLKVDYTVEWMWGDPNRPETPNERDIPMVNADRVKFSTEVYAEILEAERDGAEVKAAKARFISAMVILMIGLVVGAPLLWMWRWKIHGDQMYRVQVDAFLEEELKSRPGNQYM